MKKFTIITVIMILSAYPVAAQMFAPSPADAPPSPTAMDEAEQLAGEMAIVAFSEASDDPGYKTYKEGYNLILEESWSKARKKFSDLLDKYPKSKYADDARYWSAYALKHTDRKEALEAYRTFINENPKSSYYDEAFNDYLELNGGSAKGIKNLTSTMAGKMYVDRLGVSTAWAPLPPGSAVTVTSADSPHLATPHAVVAPGRGFTYSYGHSSNAKVTNRKMLLAERQIQRQLVRLSPPRAPKPTAPLLYFPGMEEEYDNETRLKMDALYAIGDTKEDSISYKTLRDVAVDRKQPQVLRETAMDALANFSQYDVLPVFVEIAKKDTNKQIQNLAIDYMGQLSKNKNKSIESLTELYEAIPPSRTAQRQIVLASIAEIGNDKAVDFLAKVARTSDNYDLRSDAVYYLGNIGGDGARAALYDILKGK